MRYGTTGKPVPGYDARLVDEDGRPVPRAARSATSTSAARRAALMYWDNREKSRATFQGAWTERRQVLRSTTDGYYVYAGRSDDMLKVGGIYVSPFEVEAALVQHPAVLEARRGRQRGRRRADQDQGVRRAEARHRAGDALADDAEGVRKERLAPYKYPRWIEFIDELPKTATGKIQRFKLRS